MNPINFLEWQARNHSFERIAANVEYDVSLTGDGEPEVVDAVSGSDGFFDILGVKPILGRWFTAKEDTPGNDNVVIIGESLWRRRYGADPGVLGRKLLFSNTSVVIVGVMPASFRFSRRLAPKLVAARDRSGAGAAQRTLSERGGTPTRWCDARFGAGRDERDRGPASKGAAGFRQQMGHYVVGLREQATGDVRAPLLILLGAVGLVLLIACANVANLLLMRAAGRSREIAVRSALGAGAVRIVRRLLIESTLLACLSGAAGLLVGLWAIKILTAALPDTIAYANLKNIRLDTVVFLFTLGVSLATGLLFGIAPALKAMRIDVQSALKDGGRGIAGGRSFTRGALVVAEVALSMILLVGAGLLIRSFSRLAAVDPGFDAPHVLSMRLVRRADSAATTLG